MSARGHDVQPVLNQMNGIPGVLGSMVCSANGQLLAHAFPPGFDTSRLPEAAAAIADRTAALETSVGDVGALDLRYAGGRIVVKRAGGNRLLFLCTPAVNLHLLAISTSAVAHRLAALSEADVAPVAPAPAAVRAAAPAPAPAASPLWELAQRIEARIAARGGDAFKLRGEIGLKAGIALALIDPDAPSDPAQVEALRAAAREVLGSF